MNTEDISKLKAEADVAREEAHAAALDAASSPGDLAKQEVATELAKRSSDANAALAAAEAHGLTPPAHPTEPSPANELAHAPWWHYVLIGAAMGLLLLGVAQSARCVFRDRAERMTGAYRLAPADTSADTNSNGSTEASGQSHRNPTACPAASPKEKGDFILRQRAKVVELGDGHRYTAIEFGSFFFANTVILAVFGFISLISLLLITKRGITNAHGTLVAVFLLSSGVGLIYQGMFGVFQQKSNVDSNHTQSVEYGRLVDEIDTYCATGKLAISDPNIVLAKLAENVVPAGGAAANPAPPAAQAKGAEADGKTVEALKSFFVFVGPDEFILYLEWRTEALRKFSISLDEKPVQSLTDPARMTGL